MIFVCFERFYYFSRILRKFCYNLVVKFCHGQKSNFSHFRPPKFGRHCQLESMGEKTSDAGVLSGLLSLNISIMGGKKLKNLGIWRLQSARSCHFKNYSFETTGSFGEIFQIILGSLPSKIHRPTMLQFHCASCFQYFSRWYWFCCTLVWFYCAVLVKVEASIQKYPAANGMESFFWKQSVAGSVGETNQGHRCHSRDKLQL